VEAFCLLYRLKSNVVYLSVSWPIYSNVVNYVGLNPPKFKMDRTRPNSLAGNVLICHVFPSLHLQTWRVVSATCLRSCRRLGDIACRLECLKDTTFDDIWRHLTTCRRHTDTQFSSNIKMYGSYSTCTFELTWTSAVIEINWVCRGLFLLVVCCRDMPFLEKLADIAVSGWHVGNMSATFAAKPNRTTKLPTKMDQTRPNDKDLASQQLCITMEQSGTIPFTPNPNPNKPPPLKV
jgi:hypothetical protein